MVDEYKISYHERDLGKLFCDDSAKDILNMLLAECDKANVDIRLNSNITKIGNNEAEESSEFNIETSLGKFQTVSLVIACGGLSIPKMCASPLGYQVAEQFGHHVLPTSAGLVPFTLQPHDKEKYSALSGIAIESIVSNERTQFKENILFTHRGLSGPAILQISSYWKPGETININLVPELDLSKLLKERKLKQPNIRLKTVLSEILPKRVILTFLGQEAADETLQTISHLRIEEIATQLQQWKIKPNATEGYRTAEVTLGGVDTKELSSKTMESSKVSGLYFIGEVVDVTGWLGGYNFQWAWSSGWCAGQVV
jgi:predicted Rossmann fold flavoprotein